MADSRPAVLQAAGRSRAAVSARTGPNVKLISLLALGPPVITTLITAPGIAGTLGMLGPSVLMAALILTALPLIARKAAAPRVAVGRARGATSLSVSVARGLVAR